MSRRHLGGLAAAALVGATLASIPHGAVAAAPTHGPNARALAAASAQRLIASHAPALKVSSHDTFRALPVQSSHGIQYAAVHPRLPRPARRRRRLRRRHQRPRPDPHHLGRPDPRGRPALDHPDGERGPAPCARRATRSPTHPQHSRSPRRVAARRAVPARLADHRHRPPGRDPGHQDRRRRRPQRPRAPGQGARRGRHRQLGLGRQQPHHPDDPLRQHVLDDRPQPPDDQVPERHRQRDVHRHRRRLGQRRRRPTARPPASTRCTSRTARTTCSRPGTAATATTAPAAGWPIRIGLNDENAFYDGTQVQIGHNTQGQWIAACSTCSATSRATASTTTPRAASRATAPRSSSPTRSAPRPSGSPTTRSTRPTSPSARRSTWSAPARSATCTTRPWPATPTATPPAIPTQEVHAAAGPGNHWFYLLAEGTNPTNGQPTSPTCNSTTVTGIGIQKAEQIMYNAMLMKTSTSSYLKYRTWTLTAAKNLDATCGHVQRRQGRLERRLGARAGR